MFGRPCFRSRGLGIVAAVALGLALAALGGKALATEHKYTLSVPNGLAFSGFRGYQNWQVVTASQTEELLKVMVASPTMIDAYRVGVPGNGKPFPDGSKIAKNRVETEKEHGVAFFCEGTGHFTRRFPDREEQQEIPRHEGMGIRRI
jgi:hypothetical protein